MCYKRTGQFACHPAGQIPEFVASTESWLLSDLLMGGVTNNWSGSNKPGRHVTTHIDLVLQL